MSPSIILITCPSKTVFCDKVVVVNIVKKINKNILFIIVISFSLSNIAYSKDGELKTIQYHFSNNHKFFTASVDLSTRVDRRIFFNHKDLFNEALKFYNDSEGKFSYQECGSEVFTDFLIKFEPIFFYNPLMNILYSDLYFYIFSEESKLLKKGVLKQENVLFLNIRPDIQLPKVYLDLLNKLEEFVPEAKGKSEKINGDICKIL